jgi:hypothetical protein
MTFNLLKAAFYKPSIATNNAVPELPNTVLSHLHSIDPEHCQRYHKLVKWQPGIASVAHPCYLQILTLPMQLSLITKHPFPFKPMGLVHLANTVKVHKLLEQSATLQLDVSFGHVQKHKRGWVFEVDSKAFIDKELITEATSFYLARTKHGRLEQENSGIEDYQSPIVNNFEPQITAPEHEVVTSSVTFATNIGRHYAKVSGDYNPIHLSKWTAKPLGFRRAIAHGMYSKALCLSRGLGKTLCSASSDISIATEFLQPLYLANSAELITKEREGVYIQSLVSSNGNKRREHLRTQVLLS